MWNLSNDIRESLERYAQQVGGLECGAYSVDDKSSSRVSPAGYFTTRDRRRSDEAEFLSYWSPAVQEAVTADRDGIVQADLLPKEFETWACIIIVRDVVTMLRCAFIAYVPLTANSDEARKLEAKLQIERLRFQLVFGRFGAGSP